VGDPTDRDLPRDEHLRAALRHAPDAALGAPLNLGAQICAAAWRAAGTAPVAPPADAPTTPQRLWQWLSRPGRMGASGAFATVLVAGVIGLVWRGEVPPPHVDERPAAAARTSAAVPMAADPASVAAPEVVGPKAERMAPTAERRNAATDDRPAAAPRTVPQAAPAPAPEPAPSPPPQSVPAPSPEPALPAAAAGAALPPAEPVPGRSRAENNDTAGPRSAAPQAAPPAAAPALRNSPSPSRESARAFSKAADAASSAGFAGWLGEASARADPSALLTELAASTRGRWLPATAPPQGLAAFELPRHAGTAAALTVGDDAVWGCLDTPVPHCQRAPLTPEQAARLRGLMGSAPR